MSPAAEGRRSVARLDLMNLTAIFESWHIDDGNYPPLTEGQLVNLTFELEPRKVEEVSSSIPESFEHLGKGEYCFCGTALNVYENGDDPAIAIIKTGDFRFYIMSDESNRYVQGRRYCGEGTSCLTIIPGLNISQNVRIRRTCSISLRSSES